MERDGGRGGENLLQDVRGIDAPANQIVTIKQPTPNIVQAGCPSCHPTNSVKALKGKYHIPRTGLTQAHLGVFQRSLAFEIWDLSGFEGHCLCKGYTLDIAPLRSESAPQKRSGMARVLNGFHSFTCTPTRSSAIGMSHTCLCLPSYNWYSFTDPGRMEG